MLFYNIFIRFKFYLNVVGYKASFGGERQTRKNMFYLNVVGYKVFYKNTFTKKVSLSFI